MQKNLSFSGSSESFEKFMSENKLETTLQPSSLKRKAGDEDLDGEVIKKAGSVGDLLDEGKCPSVENVYGFNQSLEFKNTHKKINSQRNKQLIIKCIK